ncbi:MAG TPA: AMP-binding protein, partial [Anaeromyxobacteraceae bacterium]|nr:AMP-binding protein [Anaeromyxobacteraceae bacterium]
LHDLLHRTASRLPDKVAVTCRGCSVTYRMLEEQSNALAHALRNRGVARGDRVIIFADNSPEAATAFFGVLKADAVVSVVNPLTKAEKLRYILDDSAATALVTDANLSTVVHSAVAGSAGHLRTVIASGSMEGGALPNFAPWEVVLAEGSAKAPPPRRNIDIDLAALIYTSGSTGDPKGVMLTHRNMLTAASSIATYLGLREEDAVMSALPLAFDYGLYQLIMCVRQGARLILDRSFAFAAKTLDQLVAERATFFPGVPTMFSVLAQMDLSHWDLSNVRAVTNTAAALHQRHIDALQRIFTNAQIFSMYGLTECKRVSYMPPAELHRKPDSVGIAIPNTELWIVDDRGQRLPPGEVGQLVVRGATVMRGYWRKPEETARKLKPGPIPGEQVLWTGDLCRLDEEGYLYFVGRMDDVIKSRGEKVAPKEVEAALLTVAGVLEAAVVGVPDPILGQAVKAFVVLAPEARLTPKDLQRECQSRLESFMVPKYVELVTELPRTDTGKIKKTGLR